jgi:hypothetical protein
MFGKIMDLRLLLYAAFTALPLLIGTFGTRSRVARVMLAGVTLLLLGPQIFGLMFAAGWNQAWSGSSKIDGPLATITTLELVIYGLWSFFLILIPATPNLKDRKEIGADDKEIPKTDPDTELKRRANIGEI